MSQQKPTTHFGYQQVATDKKAAKVAEVFHSVANKYDVMNDLMSFGIHRFWKRNGVGLLQVKPGHRVLDLAGGSGDLSKLLAPIVGPQGQILLVDINESMLKVGRDRLINAGILSNVDYVLADGEQLPFIDNYFDRIIIGFGLRNFTHKQTAIQAMYRVLKPGGQMMILEFSKPVLPGLKTLYDAYSFSVLPKLGKFIANDSASYQYLAESIRMQPDQQTLKDMMVSAGFEECCYHNLTGGIVAIHRGYKI